MKTSVANPDPGLLDPWIREPGTGMGKKSGSKVPDSGMNISDHFSKSFETVFWLKILKKSLMRIRDPESSWIRDGKNQIQDSG
jgi:hypothetical protein